MSGPSRQGPGGIQVRTYQSQNRFDVGLLQAVSELTSELVAHRSHIRTIFTGRFRASYTGTVLGVFWNFILPAVPISVYVLLASLRVFPLTDGIPPAIYIGFNVTVWYLLTEFVRQPIVVIKSRNAEAMKTALPLSATIASSFAQILFDSLVRLAVVLILMIVFGSIPSYAAPLTLLVALVGGLFCLGIGLILGVLNAIFPDIERVVLIALQYGIFLSGVIFPVSSVPGLAFLEVANPFNVFIRAARELFFSQRLSEY